VEIVGDSSSCVPTVSRKFSLAFGYTIRSTTSRLHVTAVTGIMPIEVID
jgi:hypothetical protein